MARDKITEYSSTASENTVVGDVNIAENSALPSDMNNAVREVLSHQKEAFGSGTPLYVDQTNNRVGIGIASSDGTLHVHSASAGSVTPQTDSDDLVVENNGHGGISVLTPDANRSAIVFGHASDNLKMMIRHDGGTSLSQIVSDDPLTFNVNGGTERMRINSSGQVLIGSTSYGASADFDNLIVGSTGDTSGITILSSGSATSGIAFADPAQSVAHSLVCHHADDSMRFNVKDNTERMRINSSGMLMLNGNNAVARFVISQDTQALNMCFLQNTNGTFGGNYFSFANASGVSTGTINQTGSTTVAYNTSSDYRLKESITYDFDATTRLKQLKPCRFNWIEDETNTLVDGFLAHEVSHDADGNPLVPEAITGKKDATKDVPNVVLHADGTVKAQGISEEDWTQGKSDEIYANDTTWVASKNIIDAQGIDQSKLVPLLVKTIQELEARITTLEGA